MYWEARKNLFYYRQVLKFAKTYVPIGERVLDVGSGDCEYITWFDWFKTKQVVDLEKIPVLEGVIGTVGDFMDFKTDVPFDLVLCLQVLEHLNKPKEFCQKLLSVGKFIIISIPYNWPRGFCRTHVQDPVNEKKLGRWVGKQWLNMAVVMDGGLKRLIAVYEGVV